VGLDALRGKVVAFYFSAHWCPPCQHFTPLLR
jgi:nucleoredoxin